jgi:hypothetical protein
MSEEKDKSFWQTLPGIITAITGLVVAITGLIAALSDYGILGFFGVAPPTATVEPVSTEFPTSTPVDSDVVLPTVPPGTAEPEPEPTTQPTCTDFQAFTGKTNPNAIVLAHTDTEFIVQYGDLDDAFQSLGGISIRQFSKSDSSGICLREWIKYLTLTHTPHWPAAGDGKGRTYHEVWLSSLTPPLTGELSSWAAIPNNILITTIDESFDPETVQIYLCGDDIPEETLGRVAYWHAATSEEALDDYLALYSGNGYFALGTVSCTE